MVANSPIERTGNGQIDYLLNRLADIERRLDQGGARSSYPFSVGHLGQTDFQIVPSPSGDGSADILFGDGAGGKMIQITTDTLYGTKIIRFFDQNGKTMMSTDALAGFGWGTPSYPYPYGGREELSMATATSKATAIEIGRGINLAYNPSLYVQPRIRARCSTTDNLKVFCQFRHADSSTYDSADFGATVGAGSIAVFQPEFTAQWNADDMNGRTAVFFKAYCDTAAPANMFAQLFYQTGYGWSQRSYEDATALK